MQTYQTEPTTLMKLSPAEFAMTWVAVVPVVIDVTMVERGMVVGRHCLAQRLLLLSKLS